MVSSNNIFIPNYFDINNYNNNNNNNMLAAGAVYSSGAVGHHQRH